MLENIHGHECSKLIFNFINRYFLYTPSSSYNLSIHHVLDNKAAAAAAAKSLQ